MRHFLLATIFFFLSPGLSAQIRVSFATPYDGTSDNFIRLTYRACVPNVFTVEHSMLSGGVLELRLFVHQSTGCPFGFVGTPTETDSFVSLAEALGDNVVLPSPLTVRLLDQTGSVFSERVFDAAPHRELVPLEDGCYFPAFSSVCVERLLSSIHISADYFPFASQSQTPVGQRAFAEPLNGQGALLNNYVKLVLYRTRGVRSLVGFSPDTVVHSTVRIALVSPTQMAFQLEGEPAFNAVLAPKLSAADWYLSGSSSKWLLSSPDRSDIFGGFRIEFASTNSPVGPTGHMASSAQWEYQGTWTFGQSRLACTPTGCDLFLTFASFGQEFLYARFPRGGLGVRGMYSELTPGSWRRILVRDED
jgi:hypothetical protein